MPETILDRHRSFRGRTAAFQAADLGSNPSRCIELHTMNFFSSHHRCKSIIYSYACGEKNDEWYEIAES